MSFQPFSAYIVDCVRTAGGKKNGRLAHLHSADLGAVSVDALIDRTGINPAAVEDVIFGCVSQVGMQSANIARHVVLSSKKLPISVPGTTVDRQCGSGQQAIHFAAQGVMSGVHDCIIAGGVEIMSVFPIGSTIVPKLGNPYDSEGMKKRFPGETFSQFKGAEMVAQKYNITREEMEKMAVASHQKAHTATQNGYFKKEIVPIKYTNKTTGETVVHDVDEGIRYPVDPEKISKLKPLTPGGRLTAAISSQLCDGSSAILICNERGLKKLGLKPRAKIVGMALAGADPVIMLSAPIPASQSVLERTNLKITDMDLYEVNEAFASVPLAWAKVLGADLNKLNVNGGAMALGHPLGSTGTKLMTTLVNELERRNGRYGLLAICEGGGLANATIIERTTDYIPSAKL